MSIIGSLERFILFEGRLDPQTALSTGYDFLTDGAIAVANALEESVPADDLQISFLIDRDPITGEFTFSWSKQDLDDALRGITPDNNVLNPADLISFNAHFNHYLSQPADSVDLYSTADLPAHNALNPAFDGRVIFSMGCQSGLSVSDVLIGEPAAAAAAAEQLNDWPQAFAQQGAAVYAGNTGFGYGDTKTVALSERLMTLFAERMDGNLMIGQAYADAKNEYFGTLGLYGVYDEKVISIATFYGLPMYRIGDGNAPVGAVQSLLASAESSTVDPSLGTDPVTGLTTATVNVEPLFELNDTVDGQYYSADDGVQYTHLRPIQPKVEVPVDRDGLFARGAIITGMTSHDESNFDVAFARPVIDLSLNEPETEFSGIVFPTRFVNIGVANLTEGRTETLNVIPGQYRSDDDPANAPGVQRLFDQMDITVYYADDEADVTPPVIHQADSVLFNGQASFVVETTDEAPGSVVRVLLLYQEEGSSDWFSIDLIKSATGDIWTGGVPITTTKVDYLVQAVDSSGNVGTGSNKGQYFEATPPPTDGPQDYGFDLSGPGGDNDWFIGDVIVTVTDLQPEVLMEVSIDGGPFTLLTGPFLVSGDGIHPITVRGSDGTGASTILGIDATNPLIEIFTPPINAVYAKDEVVEPQFICLDAGSGIVSCSSTGVDTSQDGVGTFEVTAVDRAGNTATLSRDYLVDGTPPDVDITVPADGAIFLLNEEVFVNYLCTDAVSGVATCAGPVTSGSALDTSTVGDRTFTVNASDVAGNDVQVTHTYSVHYDSPGVKKPIQGPPALNNERAGSGIPVKWELKDAHGDDILDLSTVVTYGSGVFDCDTGAGPGLVLDVETTGNSVLRFGNNHYIFDWDTQKEWSGTCRRLVIELDSGQQVIADFSFK